MRIPSIPFSLPTPRTAAEAAGLLVATVFIGGASNTQPVKSSKYPLVTLIKSVGAAAISEGITIGLMHGANEASKRFLGKSVKLMDKSNLPIALAVLGFMSFINLMTAKKDGGPNPSGSGANVGSEAGFKTPPKHSPSNTEQTPLSTGSGDASAAAHAASAASDAATGEGTAPVPAAPKTPLRKAIEKTKAAVGGNLEAAAEEVSSAFKRGVNAVRNTPGKVTQAARDALAQPSSPSNERKGPVKMASLGDVEIDAASGAGAAASDSAAGAAEE
jgi:hypothetical protein